MSDVFNLTVRLEGAAFTEYREAELVRIIRNVADWVANIGAPLGHEQKVFDANGNACGSWTVQPEPLDVRRWLAAALGHDHGSAAGSLVIDGNSSVEYCASIIRGYDDGDPLVMDMCPSPLSGDWSGDMTPDTLCRQVYAEPGSLSEYEYLSICDTYQRHFADSWWAAVLRSAHHVADDEAAERVSRGLVL